MMVHARKLIERNLNMKFHIKAIISNFWLLILLCNLTLLSFAQNAPPSVNIGDPAPPLRVREWLKGTPVQQFEKGSVYVVEFWATWCKPCKAAMPHLSSLAAKYRDSVIILGVSIYEDKSTSVAKIKAFVDSMGNQMNYQVAIQDSNFMVADWIEAANAKDNGIPATFVVNAEGRLAWIGHPKDLDEVLPKIVNNTWDLKEALTKRNLNLHLSYLDREASYDLTLYEPDPLKPGDLGKPDSALAMIDRITKKEPMLKYTPRIASTTFSSLLKTDLQKAYQYAKVVMVTATYEEPAYSSIYNVINSYSDILKFPAEIYKLGAEAYKAYIDLIPYPEIANTPKLYHKMAALYWRANDQQKAIDAEQKAINILKSKKDFSKADLSVYESQLQLYKKR